MRKNGFDLWKEETAFAASFSLDFEERSKSEPHENRIGIEDLKSSKNLKTRGKQRKQKKN